MGPGPPCRLPEPCLRDSPHSTAAHLLSLEPALDPLVLDAGDGVQEAAARELQALVETAVGQPLPAAQRKPSARPAGASPFLLLTRLGRDGEMPCPKDLLWTPINLVKVLLKHVN